MKRRAFTVVELMFVIVIIGILASFAIPKFAVSKNDAEIAKAKNTVAAVRNSIATKRQKQILSGQIATGITTLSSQTGYNQPIFDAFNGKTDDPVLMYPLTSCKDAKARACWYAKDRVNYIYKMPNGANVEFVLQNNSRFDCKDPNSAHCKRLTQ